MPLYEYHDRLSGKTVELVKPVAERDRVPGHLQRITVPRRVGYLTGVPDASHADAAVPRGFRQLEESGVNWRTIEKQSGFSRDHIRRVWEFK